MKLKELMIVLGDGNRILIHDMKNFEKHYKPEVIFMGCVQDAPEAVWESEEAVMQVDNEGNHILIILDEANNEN